MNKDNCNKKIYLRLIIYIICVLILYPVMNNTPLFYEYNLFVKIFYIFLIIFILDTIIFDILTYISFIAFILFILITLFYRDNKIQNIEDPTYIIKWLKLIFTNKIVFYNLIGNIILYIPLGYYAKKILSYNIYKFLIILLIPILFESLQFILHIGIFDYIDIILNIIGALLGYLIIPVRGHKNE